MKCDLNGYTFCSDFDSGNLSRVETFSEEIHANQNSNTSSNKELTIGIDQNRHQNHPDAEFCAWTRMDCEGTEFQNGNRTWFHFSIRSCYKGPTVKIHIMNLNKQGKLFSFGMAPVYKEVNENDKNLQTWKRIKDPPKYKKCNGNSVLTFTHKLPLKISTVTYFAFTYPFSYTECQSMLQNLNIKLSTSMSDKNLYYHHEVLCKSFDGNNVDLLTISSPHGMIQNTKEDLIDNSFMFPEQNRCNKFDSSKSIIFITSRVHPGETPASFVFNGLLNFLLSDNLHAIALRQKFIFKMIPMLNPDGVIKGHYRTDSRGVNLNRVYNNSSLLLHPSIHATKKLINYHNDNSSCFKKFLQRDSFHKESKLFLYLDLHGHASKRGCFIYGNYFDCLQKRVDCMLFPKILSINCPNFDFLSCNFSLKNMMMKDRFDKTNKEGSGRVSIYRMTGLIRSYTLECNYNSGKPDLMNLAYCKSIVHSEKYTPETFADVGKAIGVSILDVIEDNSRSHLQDSYWHNLVNVKQWLNKYVRGEKNCKNLHSFKFNSSSNPSSPKTKRCIGLTHSPKKNNKCQRSFSTRSTDRKSHDSLYNSPALISLPGSSKEVTCVSSKPKSKILKDSKKEGRKEYSYFEKFLKKNNDSDDPNTCQQTLDKNTKVKRIKNDWEKSKSAYDMKSKSSIDVKKRSHSHDGVIQ